MGTWDDLQTRGNAPISPTAPMWLTPEERAAGINRDLKVAARRYLCPNCGREFSLFQSRAIACKACPQAGNNCPNVRCPYCDKEYPIRGFVVPEKGENSKADQVQMTQYADKVFNNWQDRYGNNRRRGGPATSPQGDRFFLMNSIWGCLHRTAATSIGRARA